MAKRAKKRKYSKGASKEVENEMRRYKRGSAKSGRGGKGGKVESRRPARYPASAEGERILDVIARAGGPNSPGSDVWVMLERTGRRALAPFRALVEVPANNVYVLPQDTIYLYREPQTFLAFGALGIQQQIPFGTWRISLAEAVARSGGLPDNQADPASVFLYRGETREIASQLGIDVAKFEGPIVPVVYNLNLRDPAGYFLATTFEMRNKASSTSRTRYRLMRRNG